MSLSTNLISGLSSGFDWRSMIDQLIQIDNRRVELIEDRKYEYEAKLDEWQKVNSMLLALKTATDALSTESAFNVYKASTTSDTSTSASDRLTVSAGSSASPGMHQIRVDNLAQSNKISSNIYAASNTELGVTAGDILISGKVVNITATDTLADVKDKINAANTGSSPSNVTANIVQYGTNDCRLVLTSDETGTDGISILNGGGNDILFELGFRDATRIAKNHITGGDKSDGFYSTDENIKDLLGLSTTQTSALGDIKINGSDVAAIDLSSDSLEDIRAKFDAVAGVDASIITETVDGASYYRILIEGGSNSYTDHNNMLETLGILEGGVSDVKGVVGDTSNTQDGEYITSSTLIKEIDGYSGWAADDYIHLTGTDTSSGAVDDATLTLTADVTIADLLAKIDSVFGNVTSSVTADGKIMVVDNTGGSVLDVEISVKDNGGAADSTLYFDADNDLGVTGTLRSREVAAGEDASIVVDGVTVTDSSNTITDVIPGVTLNLVGEDGASEDTTITVKVERNLDSVKSKITSMKDAFNKIMDYINTQFTYDDENEKVGGILFGDGTLSSVKSELVNTVTRQITGLPSGYDYLSLIGITLDLTDAVEGKYDNMNMVIDDDELTDALETNFNEVRNLFIAYGSGSSPNLSYISHTSDTQGGSYAVNITQAATQTTVTGGIALGGTVGAGIMVTINDLTSGRQAKDIDISGMDITGVINTLNSEFAQEYTHQLTGANNTGKTASTLFSDVTGADNGDVITFTGTGRNGLPVTGSYTVATTDTVGDLLETVEDMFEDEVTVAISGGQMIITDKKVGDSQFSFHIDTQTAGITGLDFGEISTTTTGRYAMNITASEGTDGDDNKLVLTHGIYGSGQIITTSSAGGDPLGLNGSSPTKVWGENVAGTINGITATSSGQSLTLDSDGNNADGLSISYTGTTTLSSATFSFSLGVAELLDRQVGFITDINDGYVTYKQESLKNSIESYDSQIENMETSLNRKMEAMINRFVAMELALSKIQSQSDWLTGQVNAAWSAWV